MPKPSRRLLVALFASTWLAATACAATQDEHPAERLSVSQTQPEDANDPLHQWFREQDRLLDDILVRLARIENLVREIHRMVLAMPTAGTPAPSLPAPPTPAPAIVPPAAPPPTGILDEWGYWLAGAGALLLALMVAIRRRNDKRKQPAHSVPPATPAPAPAPSAPPKKSSPAPAPTAPPSTPSVQRAGAIEPAKGQSDQALELADIMLSMGLGHGAAQTLTEQIRSEPKEALRHWLKLLAIYRQNGQQAEFEKSAEELRQHFNVQPEDWQPRPDAQRSLEDYPHIAARVTELWGRPACLVYLQTLLDDNRGGSRAGFPQSVAEELLSLTAMLKEGVGGGA